jgi:hypothetical protein
MFPPDVPAFFKPLHLGVGVGTSHLTQRMGHAPNPSPEGEGL